jgi:hypothetical protein
MPLAFVESWRAAWALLFLGLAGPYLAMIGHLNFSGELSVTEKSAWRRELWWGHRSIIAVWTYLLTKDLHSTSSELAQTGRAWWRP